jgi:hypothetical protein
MTQDEIILAADASGLSYYGMSKDRDRFLHHVETFADLVTAAEREACAKLCEAQGEYGDEQYAAAIRARGELK